MRRLYPYLSARMGGLASLSVLKWLSPQRNPSIQKDVALDQIVTESFSVGNQISLFLYKKKLGEFGVVHITSAA
jgi:hypothetical protein